MHPGCRCLSAIHSCQAERLYDVKKGYYWLDDRTSQSRISIKESRNTPSVDLCLEIQEQTFTRFKYKRKMLRRKTQGSAILPQKANPGRDNVHATTLIAQIFLTHHTTWSSAQQGNSSLLPHLSTHVHPQHP